MLERIDSQFTESTSYNRVQQSGSGKNSIHFLYMEIDHFFHEQTLKKSTVALLTARTD